jgi:hypothetical protein
VLLILLAANAASQQVKAKAKAKVETNCAPMGAWSFSTAPSS